MRDILIVMKFTMKEMVKRKSFVISTLIILALIIIGFNVPNIINGFSDNDGSSVLLISDPENVFEGQLDLLKSEDIGYDVEIKNLDINKIKAMINNGDASEALFIEKNKETFMIKYIVENGAMVSEVPEYISGALDSLYTNLKLGKLGLSAEEINTIRPNFEYSIEQASDEKADGNVFSMMLMSIILFFAIYFCAYQVSSSITTEKTSKIMETLVTSTSPRSIVLGKTFGIGVVGIIQLVLIIMTALISAKAFLEPQILNIILDMSSITVSLGIITVVYFILGYITYAMLYALTGSTVSKPEDIQSANTPVALLAVVGFYLSYFTMMNPTSSLNSFASYFPISSPFCMPFRYMMGIASAADIAISIGILVITILIIAKIAIKIYSNAIFNYGTKISVKDMVKILKDKKH